MRIPLVVFKIQVDSQSASVHPVSLYGRFYLHAGTSRKFIRVRGNDQPSHFDGCFLGHIEGYLHPTWSTCSSTIDVYVQNLYVAKELPHKHLYKKIWEHLIANPSHLCTGHCFFTNVFAK